MPPIKTYSKHEGERGESPARVRHTSPPAVIHVTEYTGMNEVFHLCHKRAPRRPPYAAPSGYRTLAKLKDVEHLLRLAAVFVFGILLFILARAQFVPKSFGQYGHYRGDALKELAARELRYAGHGACEDCHSDVLAVKKSGKHAGVNCEACHGPLANHAADPASVTPQLPDTGVLCARCHEANLAKPAKFPQVDSKDHSSGAKCNTCHQPHSPLLPPTEKKS